jgi:hypothetical protein
MQTSTRSAAAREAADVDARRRGWDSWTIILGLFAVGNLGNGAWMLADPAHWYFNLPAGVPDFGPLNEHFVRDIGCAFFVQGAALAVAAFLPHWRVAACGAVAMFYGMHALVHLLDTLRGLVGAEHWLIDLPGVYIPAMVMMLVTWLVARRAA